MVQLIYCTILLFILSGMYFVTQQSAEGLPFFILQTIGFSLIAAILIVILTKKKQLTFFGSVLFFVILLVGIGQLIYRLIV